MPIRFGTYNIRNGRNRGMELALRVMSQENMYLFIFQEKNAQKESTPVSRPDNASSLRTRRADTAAE